jgi:hypothetical protein
MILVLKKSRSEFWFGFGSLKKSRTQLPKSGLVPVWFILIGTHIIDSNMPDQVLD